MVRASTSSGEQEAEMPGLHRSIETGDVHQRGQARPGPRAHHGDALPDEGTVEAAQRHDVGDRGQRDKIERREQIRLAAGAGPDALPAQFAAGRNQSQEDDAGRAEMPETGKVVLAVGIDQRLDLRKPFGCLVMIEHDDV